MNGLHQNRDSGKKIGTMRKFVSVFIMIISVGLTACTTQANWEPVTVEASAISEEYDRVQRSAEKNFEIYQERTKSNLPERDTYKNRKPEDTYENFEIYLIDRVEKDHDAVTEYVIVKSAHR